MKEPEPCPKPQQGRRDKLIPLLKAHGARCLKDEPGTLAFKVLVPRDDDAKVYLYEVYRDEAAFEVHLLRRAMTAMTALTPVPYNTTRARVE
jgi:quinol monooxygenase YgiN